MAQNRNFHRQRIFFLLIFTALAGLGRVSAQVTQPVGSVRDNTPSVHAFLHCTLVVSPNEVIPDATLLIRDGKIEAAGANVKVPSDALSHDCSGRWIFPGFIDPWTDFGMPGPDKSNRDNHGGPVYDNNQPGSHSWNAAVKPETRADAILNWNEDRAQTLRKAGFTTVNAVPTDGVFRGTSALINLGTSQANQSIAKSRSALCISFQKGSSQQQYPSSLMGTIALIRQTLLDAQWYAANMALPVQPGTERNQSLEALDRALNEKLPVLFEAGDPLNLLRALRISQEFNLPFILRSNGEDYRVLDDLRAAKPGLIVPLQFPKGWEIKDPADAREISLAQLTHWENAPWNPWHIRDLRPAFTTSGLKSADEMLASIRKVADCGMKMKGTLEALTVRPAELLGIQQQAGTLHAGKWANFIICTGNLFEYNNTEILETWVMGKNHVQVASPAFEPRGMYSINDGTTSLKLKIKGKLSGLSAKVYTGTDSADAEFNLGSNHFTCSYKSSGGLRRMRGILNGTQMEGTGTNPDGSSFTFYGSREGGPWSPASEPDARVSKTDKTPPQPFSWRDLYASSGGLLQNTVLFRNATVWTNTKNGVMENADVIIEKGKIKNVGKDLKLPEGAIEINAAGKHLTPGIIDEHSHIAVSGGVNEGSHSVSAEVRIGDVINPNDINIYRQLAGGTTCSQLLHGSANPIGGQSAIIKLRWTLGPEQLKVEDAPPFIKFALGENVKQSNWGDLNTVRYPQTRTGVEQTFRDAFQAAKDYRAAWDEYKKKGGTKSGLPQPRKVLQLETLLEILDNKRNITCHSYVQSEILMLMRLSKQMGFRVNTFTHILEGYKIADEMAAYGVNASSFSDWWAYKYEVIDAIPYNCAILHEHGVNVCINSDDVEMARRLNQEAAKAVLYGGVKEEDALKMVTLNPAKALHLEHRMGSIAPGMDADVVLWNLNPLSVYALAEKTFVDGRQFFDRKLDETWRAAIQKERTRLVQAMLGSPGEKDKLPAGKQEPDYNCGDGEHGHN